MEQNQQIQNQQTQNQCTTGWAIASFVCALISTLFFPPFIGGFGIFAGYKCLKEKKGLSIFLMIFNGICLSFGMFLGFITPIILHNIV